MADDRILYESLFYKVLALGDGMIVCRAHGVGTVYGLGPHRPSRPGLLRKRRALDDRSQLALSSGLENLTVVLGGLAGWDSMRWPRPLQ